MKRKIIILSNLCLLVLVFLLISNPLKSQTWKEILEIADSLYYKGKIDTAAILGERSLEMAVSQFGENDTNVALAYQRAGAFLFSAGYGTRSEQYWNRAIDIAVRTVGKKHLLYSKTLGYLALRYYSTMRFESADSFYTEAIFLMEKAVGTYNKDFARLLNNYGIYLISLERYSEAERIFQKSLKIRREIYKSDNIDICESLGNLSIVYRYLGNSKGADSLTAMHYKIFLEEAKTGNPQATNNGIADILARQEWAKGDYITADSLFQTSLQWLGRNVNSEKGDGSIDIRIEYARMLTEMACYDRAEQVLIEAIDRNRKYNHPNKHSIQLLNSLANINLITGKISIAESLYLQSLSLNEKIFGAEVPLAADINNDISRVYRKLGKNRKAIDYASRSAQIRLKNIFEFSPVLSEYRALMYTKSLSGIIDNYLSAYKDFKNPTDLYKDEVFTIILKSKGLVTEEVAEKEKFDMESCGAETKLLIDSLRHIKRYLSALYVRGPDNAGHAGYKKQIDSLSGLINEIETELALKSSEFRTSRLSNNITRESICAVLPDDASVIEYFVYNYIDLAKQKPEKRYIAAAVNKSGQFTLCDLGAAGRIDNAIKKYRHHFQKLSRLDRPVSTSDENEYANISEDLYQLIWDPLPEYIRNSGLVFIAPDGDINFVSFAGLRDRRGEYLVEKTPVQYISAGRDLMRDRSGTKHSEGLLAIGDPDFNATVDERLKTGKTLAINEEVKTNPYRTRNIRSSCASLYKIQASSLPSSRSEVENVTLNFKKSFPYESVELLLGSDASEERLKKEITNCRIAHIASHGYYIDGYCNNETDRNLSSEHVGENPLLLSGLLLAGANLHGDGADETSAEDGILTALEVSSLDLEGTDFVVLSACETGLGEVERGEGVYGLRRAFQLAGARTVVSSLWQIPDAETKSFMKDLYSQDAKTYPELMQKAALRRIKELRLRGKPTHPYTWGGFIATGDWRIR